MSEEKYRLAIVILFSLFVAAFIVLGILIAVIPILCTLTSIEKN